MLTASTSQKRSLSPTASGSDRGAKRDKETAESPQIEYKVRLKKDYELEWVQNLYVTAHVVQTENAGPAKSEAERDDGNKVNIRYNAVTEETSDEKGRNDENVSDDEDALSEDELEFEEETFPDDEDCFGDEDSESDNEPNAIGYLEARIICRRAIRREFWSEMEMPSQDTSQLGFELFDRYGHLRKEYITGRRKGSGVWGTEVSSGDILQVELVSVNQESRRQGIATKMLEKAIEKAREVKYVRFALAWPAYITDRSTENLPEDEQKKRREQDENTAVALFRKAGYRRVGSSYWFCFSLDANHPSRSTRPDEDYDRPDNSDQRTELEKFEDLLEEWRTKRGDRWLCVDMSDHFRGFQDDDVKKLLQLRNLPDPITPLMHARVKFGCDCGQCIAGFLSPRMHQTLLGQAEINHDMTRDEIEDEIPGLSVEERMEFSMLSFMIEHIPEPAKSNMKTNKSMRQGFCYFLNHIATCLRAKQLPNVPNVLRAAQQASEWPPHVKQYLQRGGTVEAVLHGLVDVCMDQDIKTGDGDYYETFKDEIDMLPDCRIDHEFGFVLGMLLDRPGNLLAPAMSQDRLF